MGGITRLNAPVGRRSMGSLLPHATHKDAIGAPPVGTIQEFTMDPPSLLYLMDPPDLEFVMNPPLLVYESPVFPTAGPATPFTGFYVQDLFTGSDNDPITSHVPDVAPSGFVWTAFGSPAPTGTIQTNQLRITDNGDGAIRGFVGDSLNSDGVIKMDFLGNSVNPAFGGIAFRDDGVDRWVVRQHADADIAELFDPAGVLVESKALVSGPSDLIYFELILSGTTIICLVENRTTSQAVTLTATSANNQTGTRHGPATRTVFGEGSGDRFDNFSFGPLGG